MLNVVTSKEYLELAAYKFLASVCREYPTFAVATLHNSLESICNHFGGLPLDRLSVSIAAEYINDNQKEADTFVLLL